MSTEKIYYCNTCQNGTQYSNINNKINDLSTCYTNDEYITSSFYQKSYDLLKEVQAFGDNDSNNPRLPNVDNFFTLEIKNLINELITHNFYDDIINAINNNSNSNKQYEIIYGTYWANLKDVLKNIKISNTKYWTKSCCDCDGYCSSDGWHCAGCYGQCSSYCGNDYAFCASGQGGASSGCAYN